MAATNQFAGVIKTPRAIAVVRHLNFNSGKKRRFIDGNG
jgi:hypothetical protein